MVKVIFETQDGQSIELEAESGVSLMETAIKHDVPGIVAECGGACSCATCHVYVSEADFARVGEPHEMEVDMLDFALDVRATSRLSCQIELDETLEGLRVMVPREQG